MGWLLKALFCLLIVAATPLKAQTVDPADMTLEIKFEEMEADPYVGEMVLLTVTGAYKVPIAREDLVQPSLDGFDWMQLGEDKWTEDTTRGRKIVQFERVIALFPNRPGKIEIAPFIHRLELWTSDGRRFDHEVTSEGIDLTAQPEPQNEGWWLPAREITVEDNWSNPPDKLGEGEGVLRVIAVTVKGIRPEQMPVMPELEAAGAYVFAHPEHRMTRLYSSGPVTRTFWRWTIRPEHPPSAYLKPIRVPYFDTVAREQKVIEIAAQRIAMTDEAVAAFLAEADEESVDAMEAARSADAPVYLRYAGIVAPLTLGLGLFGGLGLLLSGSGRRGWRGFAPLLARFKRDPDRQALKRAAAAGDVAAARGAALRLIERDDRPEGRAALARLDKTLFAINPTTTDLRSFRREILRAVGAKRHSAGDAAGKIP